MPVDTPPPVDRPARRVLFVAAMTCVLAIGVNARSLITPYLYYDDFGIFIHSLTWESTRANLWMPINEHCWPLTRVATWAVLQAAGSASGLPIASAVAVRVVVVTAMILVYLFVRRERGHAYYGLAAMAVFGISAVYQEAVYWYAASPALASLATALLGLLAAQRWRQTGRSHALVWSVVWSAVAPAWFAGGILAGPLCALYLFTPGTGRATRWWECTVPILGSLAFLAQSLPQAGDQILHTSHYGPRTAVESFGIVTGMVNTGRSVVDNLALGAVGVTGFACPLVVVVVGLIGLVVAGVWWWRRSTCRRLFVLGLGFVLLNDLLIYGARAGFPYEVLREWSRYNLWSWLGVTLIVSSGLSRPRSGSREQGGSAPLSYREARTLGWVIAALFVVQLPRGIVNSPWPDARQQGVLRQVDEIDARCRAHHIAAADARAVLGRAELPGDPGENAWHFLRGSDSPSPLPKDVIEKALRE